MEGYATPGKPFHVWHGGPMVAGGVVVNLLLKDGKDAGGSPMAGATRADRGTTNANAVAINVE